MKKETKYSEVESFKATEPLKELRKLMKEVEDLRNCKTPKEEYDAKSKIRETLHELDIKLHKAGLL